MTANDNIRHYIGDLETTEDIDLVFKHIYDLMLANGGEGSGLNADMVDGFHASDFAPASIIGEIEQYIQTIRIGDNVYGNQKDIVIDLFADYINTTKDDGTGSVLTVEEYLALLDEARTTVETDIETLQEVTSFLEDEALRYKLSYFANHNLQQTIDDDNIARYYIDSDSVNGLSFMLVTQAQYDVLPKEQKEDPRNIFIINNNLDSDFAQSNYTPPSILKASMELQFRINEDTRNIEFSIDGGSSWKVFMPIVGNDSNKGPLYPEWFVDLKGVIADDEDLQDQSNYPFLLNTQANQASLENTASTVKINETEVIADEGIIDISNALEAYLSDWIVAQYSDIQNALDMPDVSNLESKSNRITNISTNQTDDNYPTSKAVAEYVNSVKQTLQTNINNVQSTLQTSINGKANTNHTHSQYLTAHQSLSNYYTKAQTDSKITSLVNPKTSVSFTKSLSKGLSGFSVTCKESLLGYKVSVRCDKWTPQASSYNDTIGTFSKSLGYFTCGLVKGYMDVRINGKSLLFRGTSGTAKTDINVDFFVPK